jgi:hypothetical protein
MAENYARRFREMIRNERWSVQPFDFPTEHCGKW